MKKYLLKISSYFQQHRCSSFVLRALQELRIIDHDLNPAYAQEGEDLLIHSYLIKKAAGFYVDIGANHPKKFSSTYLFYQRGWQGICVDPWPEATKLFAKYRPSDLFVNCGIGNQTSNLNYYCFASSLMNTFDAAEAESVQKNIALDDGCRLVEVKKVAVCKLADLLNDNSSFLAARKIDFMNIDVEGGELAVLESNDWSKYLPGIIAIEIHGFDLSCANDFPVHNYLVDKGYQLIAKTQLTAIYRHQDYDF